MSDEPTPADVEKTMSLITELGVKFNAFPPNAADIRPETHEQTMACFTCFLSGLVPESHFPLPLGLWSEECPRCGNRTVWVTAVGKKGEGTNDE